MNSETMEAVLPYKIKVKPDYWRPEDTIDDISYCRNLVDNCLGGWVPGDPSCYEGHIGGLCESCDLYGTRTGERWAQSAKY